MTTPVQIHLPASATSTVVLQYIAVNPIQPETADTVQRVVQTLKQTLQPGEFVQIDLIHGHSSISLHEGEPIVRLLPAPHADQAPPTTP